MECPLPVPKLAGCLPGEQGQQVLAGVGALAVAAAFYGHGEQVAAGVPPADDGGVDIADQRRLSGDALFVTSNGTAQSVLVAVVGAFGAGEAG